MIPATYNWSIVRGTTSPFTVRLQAGDPLAAIPFTDVRLSITNLKGTSFIMRPSISDGRLNLLDVNTSEITWIPTPAESRAIPVGIKAKYELEVWNGDSEIVYMMGTIEGVGGINDDQDAS